MLRKTIYTALAGSHMYGTNTVSSDKDYRSVFMPSRKELFSLGAAKTESSIKDDIDDQKWEFRKFIGFCVNANPNALEILFADDYRADRFGLDLRSSRDLFLSKKIARTYLGYATGNFKRLSHQFPYDGKDAMHLIRLVRTGAECLQSGKLNVKRTEDREHLLKIKGCNLPWKEIESEFNHYKNLWPSLEKNSVLPDEPDPVKVEKLVDDLMIDWIDSSDFRLGSVNGSGSL